MHESAPITPPPVDPRELDPRELSEWSRVLPPRAEDNGQPPIVGSDLVEESSKKQREEALKRYYDSLLALKYPQKQPTAEVDYAKLLDPSEDLVNNSVQRAAVSDHEVGIKVTERSSVEAAKQLAKSMSVDSQLATLIHSHLEDVDINDIPEAIRKNHDLASKLLEYLDDKLSLKWYSMPTRIQAGTEKQLPGVNRKLRSRDYVLVLALSMLDGTFLPEKSSKGDEPSYEFGQHRYAAGLLLNEP